VGSTDLPAVFQDHAITLEHWKRVNGYNPETREYAEEEIPETALLHSSYKNGRLPRRGFLGDGERY